MQPEFSFNSDPALPGRVLRFASAFVFIGEAARGLVLGTLASYVDR